MRAFPNVSEDRRRAVLEAAVLAEYRPLVNIGPPMPEQVIIAPDTLLQMRTAGVILVPPATTTLGCPKSPARSGSADSATSGSPPSTNLAGRSA